MKRLQFFVLFFSMLWLLPGFKDPSSPDILKETIYAKQIKDSFEITIILPVNYSSKKLYRTVYFLDAGLKSGKHWVSLLQDKANAEIRKNTIFIGIGHKGNYHVLRRRDFIPPVLKGKQVQKSGDKNYGHANLFYQFLEKELIPFIEKKYSVNASRTIAGHSFGGLFVYYCLLKEKKLFNNYFALSPSLWVNSGNIFAYEKNYFAQTKKLPAYLYMANGSLEFANFVLPSNRRMHQLLLERKYQDLDFRYIEKQFANHNSHVPLTLQEVLTILKNR